MAFSRFCCVASVLCVANGVQIKPTVVAEDLVSDDPSVDIDDVTSQLGTVNDTISEVEDVLDSVNATVFDMLDQFLGNAGSFQSVLTTLQTAATTAAQLAGTSDILTKAQTFITSSNKTLVTSESSLDAVAIKISSSLAQLVLQLQSLADSTIGQFTDAVQAVTGLSNYTNTTLLVARTVDDVKSVSEVHEADKTHKNKKAHTTHKAHKTHKEYKTEDAHQSLSAHKAGKTHKSHSEASAKKHHRHKMALLQERAGVRSQASIKSLESAVMKKGSTNACTSATKKIVKANATLASLASKFADVNSTITELLAGTFMAKASSVLSLVNSTLVPAIAAAETVVPSSLMSPIEDALDSITGLEATFSTEVGDQDSQAGTSITASITSLSALYSLADTLEASVHQSCLAGACGASMQKTCEAADAASL